MNDSRPKSAKRQVRPALHDEALDIAIVEFERKFAQAVAKNQCIREMLDAAAAVKDHPN